MRNSLYFANLNKLRPTGVGLNLHQESYYHSQRLRAAAARLRMPLPSNKSLEGSGAGAVISCPSFGSVGVRITKSDGLMLAQLASAEATHSKALPPNAPGLTMSHPASLMSPHEE